MIKKIVTSALMFVILMSVLVIDLPGQYSVLSKRGLGEPRFDIDIATFRSEAEDEVRLELYYKIYNDGLKFFKKKDKFVANYELNVVILGEDNHQITGSSVERYYRLDNYKATRNPNDYLINLMKISVGKGKFKAVCKLIDKNTNKITTVEKEFEIVSLYKGKNDISDLEYIKEVADIDTISSKFDKGEKRIIPAVDRVFGNDIEQISFYTELYHNEDKHRETQLKFDITDHRDKKIYEDEYELTLELPITRYIKHIPLDKFIPGVYNVKVELAEKSGKGIAKTISEFQIAWSSKAFFSLSISFLRATYLSCSTARSKSFLIKACIDQAIWNSEIVFAMPFPDFWKEKDPTPGTPQNELMEKYYGRINHVNNVFTSLFKEGWRTDMGMIFIIYGEPDHIENHPFELSEKPSEIWYYYSLSRTFGFVDEIGTGEYRLQFPYDGKRGFINDRIDDYE